MTVSTTSASITIGGNGAASVFSFPFVCPDESSISVLYTDTDGEQTLLTAAQYTVTLNAPGTGQLWSAGGTVTYPVSGSPIADGTSLTIFRNDSLTQDVTIRNQGNFYAEVTEEALDLQCMISQQVAGRSGRIMGDWATGVDYLYADVVQDGANGDDTGNFYMCVEGNTSNVWQDDLEAGYWTLAINVAQIESYATEAQASAEDAAASQISAASSASAAATSAAAALVSENAASASASAASNSASSASTSASTATTQASNASSSASAASASASAAAASETAAGVSATAASNSAISADTSASNAATSASEAAASASQAAGTLLGTSTTSNSIGTGAKTFTTQSGLALGAGGFVTVAETSSPANYMHGQVTSYSGITLIIDSLDTGGSGTIAAWTITTSSPQGPAGVGAGTVNSGTSGQINYYAATGDTTSGNASLNISAGQLTIGQAASVQGSVRLAGSTSGTTTIAAPVTGTGTMTLQAGTDTIVARTTTDTLTNKTITASSNVLGGVTMTLGSDGTGDIYYRSAGGVLTRLANGGANTVLHGSGTVPAYSAVVEADITLSDVTTNNATTSAHGFLKKLSNSATQFMDGVGNWDSVTDADLSTSDITTNNATSSKHGFCPKLSNDANTWLNGTGGWTAPSSTGYQPQMTVFTSSGTFTTSANITSSTVFKFTVTGGGGGGGGAATSSGAAGGGGGAGSTAIYVVSGLSASTGYTVTIGAAGSAGASSGGNGGAGGASTVVIGLTTITGGGGSGGIGGANNSLCTAGGSGGTATNGTINILGGSGCGGMSNNGTGGGGVGGSSILGGGGSGGTDAAGSAGQAYGSGGGGGGRSGTNRAGGAGKAGIVIVEWFE